MIRPGNDADGPAYIRLIGEAWAEFPGVIFDVDAELPELHHLASWFAASGGMLWLAEARDAKPGQTRDAPLGQARDATLGQARGAPLGMVATRPLGSDSAWEICRMYLDRAARGTGLAQRLLATAEAHARAHGAQRMVLWTDTRFEAAHRFYEKQSYVRQGAMRILDDLSKSLEFRYAKPLTGLVVDILDGAAASSAERRLAEIVVASVAEGGSLHWRRPLADERARAVWKEVAADVAAQHRLLLAAWAEGELAGVMQIDLAQAQTQPHRAMLGPWLVHPALRGKGVGRALLARAEQAAARLGRRVLSLETPAGCQGERLLRAAGWREVGRIPGHALDEAGQAIEAVTYLRG